MIRFSTIIILSTIFLIFSVISINAASKKDLPYEINDITINKRSKTLEIRGWAFITDAQNFRDNRTHKYTLYLSASDHNLTSVAKLTNISHTETMKYNGSRWCNNSEFNKSSLVCNNTYNNIGFVFSIPLKDFKMDREYKADLKVDAIQSNRSERIPIYFPVKDRLVLKDNKNNYIVDSKLNDMSLKVIFSHVLVRDKAGKTGSILESRRNCSSSKKLHYKNNATFYNIYDKEFLNNTTYYKLSAREIGCFGSNPLIEEGNDIYPVWIASNFVDYYGQQLTVQTKYENTFPVLSISHHPVIYVDDKIDFFEGVTASDKEDGNITHKIEIYKNNFINKPGMYEVVFKVIDVDGLASYGTKNVTVLKRNYPPVINANDIEIKQYIQFNPYLNVSAFDQDMDNITSKIMTTNTIDTSSLLAQKQCYTVTDKYNLTTNKCINVSILKRESDFRFIQKDNLFYKEAIPLVWKEKLIRLKSEISNEITYIKRNISN